MHVELCDTTRTLLEEIADKDFTRDHVVLTYALALLSSETTNWLRVNKAIRDRWSLSALEYIKRRAWKMAAERKRGD